MKQLYIFPPNNGGTVEFREGATGFSVEVNHVQVFWSGNQQEALKLFNFLVAALDAN